MSLQGYTRTISMKALKKHIESQLFNVYKPKMVLLFFAEEGGKWKTAT
jgi:hypothetical protein